MSAPNTTPPGWYPNPQGNTQWWDGRQWGQFAPAAPIIAYAPQPAVVYVRQQKDVGIAYLFAILLGGFGAHRLYLGRIGTAIVFMVLWLGGGLLTIVGIGFLMMFAAFIWWIVDLCNLPSMVRESNISRTLPPQALPPVRPIGR